MTKWRMILELFIIILSNDYYALQVVNCLPETLSGATEQEIKLILIALT